MLLQAVATLFYGIRHSMTQTVGDAMAAAKSAKKALKEGTKLTKAQDAGKDWTSATEYVNANLLIGSLTLTEKCFKVDHGNDQTSPRQGIWFYRAQNTRPFVAFLTIAMATPKWLRDTLNVKLTFSVSLLVPVTPLPVLLWNWFAKKVHDQRVDRCKKCFQQGVQLGLSVGMCDVRYRKPNFERKDDKCHRRDGQHGKEWCERSQLFIDIEGNVVHGDWIDSEEECNNMTFTKVDDTFSMQKTLYWRRLNQP
jgi:hypothetical protein